MIKLYREVMMAPIIIKKETPHLYMWFSDGRKIPKGRHPLPQGKDLDYVRRLKEECAKLFLTKTPAYLVYMGRLLNDDQKSALIALEREIPNLRVMDYDDVEKEILIAERPLDKGTDSFARKIQTKVAELAAAYQAIEKLHVGEGGIADLVDFTRLVLVYHSHFLEIIAKRNHEFASRVSWCEGLIYRDFDVTLQAETMPDIPTIAGYMGTLNLTAQANDLCAAAIERLSSTEKTPDRINRIKEFFNKNIHDPRRFEELIQLFLDVVPLTDESKADKLAIEGSFREISPAQSFRDFILSICAENSFLAFYEHQNPLLGDAINKCLHPTEKHSAYGVVQYIFGRIAPRSLGAPLMGKYLILKEYLEPARLGFCTGNDLTWTKPVGALYSVEPTPAIAPLLTSDLITSPPIPEEVLLPTPRKEHGQTDPIKPDQFKMNQPLIYQVAIIKAKEKELREKGYILAADCAKNLHEAIDLNHKALIDGMIKFEAFKANCTSAIQLARPVLEKHRGWKQILGNVALEIAGLGIFYVMAGLIHKKMTGRFLFFNQTDSASKLDQLASLINGYTR